MTGKTLDVDGQKLKVGDRVAYQSGGRYPALRVTTVTGFSPRMVKTTLGTVWSDKLAKLYNQEEEGE